MLQSQPISAAPSVGLDSIIPFGPPAPAPPLAEFQGHVPGRVGCGDRPDLVHQPLAQSADLLRRQLRRLLHDLAAIGYM